MSLIEELEELNALHRSGALSDSAFAEAKAELLGDRDGLADGERPDDSLSAGNMEEPEPSEQTPLMNPRGDSRRVRRRIALGIGAASFAGGAALLACSAIMMSGPNNHYIWERGLGDGLPASSAAHWGIACATFGAFLLGIAGPRICPRANDKSPAD
jgi:hypothetical protein